MNVNWVSSHHLFGSLCFVIRFHLIATRSFLLFVGKILGMWVLLCGTASAGIVGISFVRSFLLSVKLRMVEVDSTLPLPLHNRRRWPQSKFRLRITRRQLKDVDGKSLERIGRQIDGLIEAHDLLRFRGMPEGPRPAAFYEVEMLLKERSELLGKYLLLPSFSYLIRRRLAWRLIAARSKQ